MREVLVLLGALAGRRLVRSAITMPRVVSEHCDRGHSGLLSAVAMAIERWVLEPDGTWARRAGYGVAVVKGAKQPEQAKAFVDGLLSGAGRDALDRAGFLPPPGT